jgi:hypothetical protein
MVSREQFLNLSAAIREENVPELGGVVKYRQATQGDKGAARRRSMLPGAKGEPEMDSERLECVLVQMCLVEPKLEIQDVDQLMKLPAKVIGRLAALAIGTVDPN